MYSRSRRILLTGASGFIGKRLQVLLLKRDYRLRILTRQSCAKQADIEYIMGDLTDAVTCQHAVNEVATVIHAAGVKRIASAFWPVNVKGTRNLLDAAIGEDVERFVHLSSVGVIGVDLLKCGNFGETNPCKPKNEYERSKREAEDLVNCTGLRGLPVTVLRRAKCLAQR